MWAMTNLYFGFMVDLCLQLFTICIYNEDQGNNVKVPRKGVFEEKCSWMISDGILEGFWVSGFEEDFISDENR